MFPAKTKEYSKANLSWPILPKPTDISLVIPAYIRLFSYNNIGFIKYKNAPAPIDIAVNDPAEFEVLLMFRSGLKFLVNGFICELILMLASQSRNIIIICFT